MIENDVIGNILAEVEEIPFVDTHDHLMFECARRHQKIDFFSWFPHEISTDLISSGMEHNKLEAMKDPETPLEKRWAILEPFWHNVITTGCGQVLLCCLVLPPIWSRSI